MVSEPFIFPLDPGTSERAERTNCYQLLNSINSRPNNIRKNLSKINPEVL